MLRGNISNKNVSMEFAQFHYFLSQNVGGTKDILSLLSKSWGRTCPPVPPINTVPAPES